MPKWSHLIALDADVAEVKAYLKNDHVFTHWWSYLPSVFLVTSDLTANEITDRLRPVTGEASFLVSRVNLDDTEGWLPSRSWRWIKNRMREARAQSSVGQLETTRDT